MSASLLRQYRSADRLDSRVGPGSTQESRIASMCNSIDAEFLAD